MFKNGVNSLFKIQSWRDLEKRVFRVFLSGYVVVLYTGRISNSWQVWRISLRTLGSDKSLGCSPALNIRIFSLGSSIAMWFLAGSEVLPLGSIWQWLSQEVVGVVWIGVCCTEWPQKLASPFVHQSLSKIGNWFYRHGPRRWVTEYASSIRPFQRQKNGREAFLAIIAQFARPDKWQDTCGHRKHTSHPFW